MIEYQHAFIKTKAQGISIFPTHNLEVPGSSPGWSTKKETLIARNQAVSVFLFGVQ